MRARAPVQAGAAHPFNLVAAAVAGKAGEPGSFRDYKLRQIMQEKPAAEAVNEHETELVLS